LQERANSASQFNEWFLLNRKLCCVDIASIRVYIQKCIWTKVLNEVYGIKIYL